MFYARFFFVKSINVLFFQFSRDLLPQNIVSLTFSLLILVLNVICLIIIDNSRKYDWKKLNSSKSMKNQFFPSYFLKYLWWDHFPSQIFQKLWVEKLILHTFWKIPLFPVTLSWIIYDNELKTVKYISPTKSIRREN